MLVPDRVWALLTDEEQRLIRETVNGERKRGREIICPHCHEAIKVSTTINVRTKDEYDTEPPPKEKPAPVAPSGPSHLTSARDGVLLETARASGMLDAFARALTAEKEHAGVPNDVDGFFLAFIRLMAPVIVPRVALAAWIDEFGGRIEVYGANGVLAIASDMEIKEFVPNRYVRTSTTAKGPQLPTAASFEQWTKGRFGYVPSGSGAFSAALRQQNIGKFGAIVQ